MSRRRKWKNKGKVKDNVMDTVIKNVVPFVKKSWEAKIETMTECGKAPSEIIVWFSPIVKLKIDRLMEVMGNIEWLGYLIGDKETYTVTNIWIPSQKVTSTSVNNVECPEYNELSVIGVIHSHHNMGSTFSVTDDEWINQNHGISMCVSKDDIKGHVRWKTPCGGLKFIKAISKLKMGVILEKDKFDKVIKDNIKKQIYTTPLYSIKKFDNNEWVSNNYPGNIRTVGGNHIVNPITIEEKNEVDELNFDDEMSLQSELEMLEISSM